MSCSGLQPDIWQKSAKAKVNAAFLDTQMTQMPHTTCDREVLYLLAPSG
jgi:hypothetical protein